MVAILARSRTQEMAAGPQVGRRRIRLAARYVAPWYLANSLLGLVASGLLPFLLPLMVAARADNLNAVALVIGSYNVGLLSAPVIGIMAERHRLFRACFFGGFLVDALALAAMPAASDTGVWMILAVAIGAGTAAASTLAALFIVDFRPRSEWEPRIGWLQSFNGAGQLTGLLLAGYFANGGVAWGLWLAAALAGLAVLVGRVGLPRGGGVPAAVPVPLDIRGLIGFPHAAPAPDGMLVHAHRLRGEALRNLAGLLGTPFARFLLSWAFYNFAVAGFFAYYPLLMWHGYGVVPAVTAVTYALAAAIGVGLFILGGLWAKRFGAHRVYVGALLLRCSGFCMLGLPWLGHLAHAQMIAIIGFLSVVLAWPLLSVSGTALAARLTPIGEGAAMGLLSASGAAATVIGTFLAGPLVLRFGFATIPVFALSALAMAVVSMRGVSAR